MLVRRLRAAGGLLAPLARRPPAGPCSGAHARKCMPPFICMSVASCRVRIWMGGWVVPWSRVVGVVHGVEQRSIARCYNSIPFGRVGGSHTHPYSSFRSGHTRHPPRRNPISHGYPVCHTSLGDPRHLIENRTRNATFRTGVPVAK